MDGHAWVRRDGYRYDTCEICGIVRRADDKNNPCKGPVKIGLREPEPQPTPDDECKPERPHDAQGCSRGTLGSIVPQLDTIPHNPAAGNRSPYPRHPHRLPFPSVPVFFSSLFPARGARSTTA